MAQTIIHLQRLLSSYGITFHSYTEPHLATDNELVRNILVALLSSLAKVEAQKISERTRAGMALAKARGIRIGRPRIGVDRGSRHVKDWVCSFVFCLIFVCCLFGIYGLRM
jgi:DNA invertase Pin-like site-specific DNA recombinase